MHQKINKHKKKFKKKRKRNKQTERKNTFKHWQLYEKEEEKESISVYAYRSPPNSIEII